MPPFAQLFWYVLAVGVLIHWAVIWFQHAIALAYGKWRLHHTPEISAEDTKGVSIIKPLVGYDANLHANLETFFKLKYPLFELLFCLESEHDLALPVVEELAKTYPTVDVTIKIDPEKKWKGLRDTFGKYRRETSVQAKKSGSAAVPTVTWKYYKTMEFIIPYMSSRKMKGNAIALLPADVDEAEADDDNSETLPVSSLEESQSKPVDNAYDQKKIAYKRKCDPVENEILTKIREPDTEKDDALLFLESLAPTLRRLTTHQQALVKLKFQEYLYNVEFGTLRQFVAPPAQTTYQSAHAFCTPPAQIYEPTFTPEVTVSSPATELDMVQATSSHYSYSNL